MPTWPTPYRITIVGFILCEIDTHDLFFLLSKRKEVIREQAIALGWDPTSRLVLKAMEAPKSYMLSLRRALSMPEEAQFSEITVVAPHASPREEDASLSLYLLTEYVLEYFESTLGIRAIINKGSLVPGYNLGVSLVRELFLARGLIGLSGSPEDFLLALSGKVQEVDSPHLRLVLN